MEVNNSGNIQDEHLTLLVTQLQNQDPLDPVSQEDFIGQVTEFSTLAEIESLNTSFDEMVQLQNDLFQLQEIAIGTAMVGQQAEYNDAEATRQQGTIQGFEVADGRIQLVVNDQRVSVADVLALS